MFLIVFLSNLIVLMIFPYYSLSHWQRGGGRFRIVCRRDVILLIQFMSSLFSTNDRSDNAIYITWRY